MAFISDFASKAKGFVWAGASGLAPMAVNYLGEAIHCPMAEETFQCNYAGDTLAAYPKLILGTVATAAAVTTAYLLAKPDVGKRAYKYVKETVVDKPYTVAASILSGAGGAFGWGLAKTASIANGVGQYYRAYGQLENPNLKEITKLRRETQVAKDQLEEARGDLENLRNKIYVPRNEEFRDLAAQVEFATNHVVVLERQLAAVNTGRIDQRLRFDSDTIAEQQIEILRLEKQLRVAERTIELLAGEIRARGGDVRVAPHPTSRASADRSRIAPDVSMTRRGFTGSSSGVPVPGRGTGTPVRGTGTHRSVAPTRPTL